MSFRNPFLKIPKSILVIWLVLLFVGIGIIFWYNEWKFNLPTPIPTGYKDVKTGTYIDLEEKFASVNKPVFIHFYNPECPCSRFNIPHVRSLINNYKSNIDFLVVVMNTKEEYSIDKIQDKFGEHIPVLFDEALAKSCGVYSTPQAVLLNSEHKLYYRGNYNKNRYCTEKKSNFAQMAIDSLLNSKSRPVFNSFATKAYGCELPNCKKP